MAISPIATREALITSLMEARFDRNEAERLAGHARPATGFEAVQAEAGDTPLGHSKLGGLPDLAPGQAWPIRAAYENAAAKIETAEKISAAYSATAASPFPYLDAAYAAQTRAQQAILGKPFALFFVAQINFAEVAAANPDMAEYMPQTGLLSLFYDVLEMPWGFDPADRQGFEVLWFDGNVEDLKSASQPADLKAFILEDLSHQRAAVQAAKAAQQADEQRNALSKWLKPSPEFGFFIPELYSLDAGTERLDALPVMTMPGVYGEMPQLEPEIAARHAPNDNTDLLLERWYEQSRLAEGLTQVGGHPYPVQDPDMRLQCQLVTNGIYLGEAEGYRSARAKELAAGAEDWVFLAQIASSEHGRMWGDSGMLYIWIRKQDLAARAFDKAWVILQSY